MCRDLSSTPERIGIFNTLTFFVLRLQIQQSSCGQSAAELQPVVLRAFLEQPKHQHKLVLVSNKFTFEF